MSTLNKMDQYSCYQPTQHQSYINKAPVLYEEDSDDDLEDESIE